MPRTVTLHQLEDLATGSEKKEILLQSNLNTELHIRSNGIETIISFPFGNKFDVINGLIIIHEK